jgi:TM2 domain-containing membrane protein YozV
MPRWEEPPLSNDARVAMRYDANKKSELIAYLLWFFLGGFGAHRFYVGRIHSAIGMVLLFLISTALTLVLIGYVGIVVWTIWWAIDAFKLPSWIAAYNNALISDLLER